MATLRQWKPQSADDADGDHQAHAEPLPAEASPLAAVLDYEIVSSLQAMGDESNPDFFRHVIEVYFESTQELIEALEQAIQAAEIERVAHTAHTLKGSSDNVGAIGMAAICHELQAIADTENVDGVDACFTKLKSEFARVYQALTDFPA